MFVANIVVANDGYEVFAVWQFRSAGNPVLDSPLGSADTVDYARIIYAQMNLICFGKSPNRVVPSLA